MIINISTIFITNCSFLQSDQEFETRALSDSVNSKTETKIITTANQVKGNITRSQ